MGRTKRAWETVKLAATLSAIMIAGVWIAAAILAALGCHLHLHWGEKHYGPKAPAITRGGEETTPQPGGEEAVIETDDAVIVIEPREQ
ncbi:MAG: hypothetical protein AABZ12_03525 [Planctomycetota bacterium]